MTTMVRLLNWGTPKDIAIAKDILWFAYRQLPAAQNLPLEKRIDTLERSISVAKGKKPTLKFFQDFYFPFQDVDVGFIFDVASANKIAQYKRPNPDSKKMMKLDSAFLYDREADGTRGTSNQPIVLAPLFGNGIPENFV